jgi:hypothetical protein
VLAAWELSGWDVDRLARDGELRALTAAAMREALAVGDERRTTLGRLLRHTPPGALSLLMRALPTVAGEQVRAMWSHHGPKVAAQTRQMLDGMLARAEASGAPVEHLRRLRERLPSTPA